MISPAITQLKPHLWPLLCTHTLASMHKHTHYYCYYSFLLPLVLITWLIGLMNGALWTVMCLNRPLESLASLCLTREGRMERTSSRFTHISRVCVQNESLSSLEKLAKWMVVLWNAATSKPKNSFWKTIVQYIKLQKRRATPEVLWSWFWI